MQYFDGVYSMVERAGCIMTHIPVHPYQLKRYKLNIHGHTHSSVVGPGYVCASVEQIGLAPVLLDNLINKAIKEKEYHDSILLSGI
jgi:calcineurin-like phosphoesterase family protein